MNQFSASSVLPQNADLYLRLPIKTNQVLCETLLNFYMPDLVESSKEKLITSANTIFASVKTEDDVKKIVDIAVEGKFPFYTSWVLTKKMVGLSKQKKKGT